MVSVFVNGKEINEYWAQAKRRVYHVQLGGEKRKAEKKGKRAKPSDDGAIETGGKLSALNLLTWQLHVAHICT